MGKKKCCVRRWTSQMKEERKFTEEEGAVKVKEGNSFPFSFVQLPRGSPFISLPLTCFSASNKRFPGGVFTSLFCPSHLVFIRNPKKHSTTFFLPLVWLCYCVCSVNASCRRLFLLSQLSLLFFSGSFSFLLSSPAYMWSNYRHWSPEFSKITPGARSFLSFVLLFFSAALLLWIQSQRQAVLSGANLPRCYDSPVWHDRHKKFSDSTSMTLLYLLQLYLSALYISMYIMLGNTAAEIVLISRLWQKLLCIFNPSLHNHILKKVQ